MSDELYIGLMSGTSIDAIDAALISCNGKIEVVATHEHVIPSEIQQRIKALSRSGDNEIEALGMLDRELGLLFAAASRALIEQAGTTPASITAIGSHGQTIRHRPPSAGHAVDNSFTLQIGDPNTLAEATGITTVADFRRRDIAAGGEGAPLAPAFHAAAFARSGVNRAVINIGGIANATILAGKNLHAGFDTGPGNTLLDQWVERHQGQQYDRDGQWSSEGTPDQSLLCALMNEEYFALRGPRSTGKELFNLEWLDSALAQFSALDPRDVQATLAEVTAQSIAQAIINADSLEIEEVYICGGGARNTDLMRRLFEKVSPRSLHTTAAIGIEPEWVEAAAFGWFAHRTLQGLPANAPSVTAARGPRVLGGIYHA